MVALRGPTSYGLLPASWEEHIAELNKLLPWRPIKYHTASPVQRKLVDHIGMSAPSQTQFVKTDLLPAINRTNSLSTEPLLLKAIEVAALSAGLTSIFIDGSLHPINRTVDSSSSLLQALFREPSTKGAYKLLPQLYTTPACLAALKRHGLAHLSSCEPDFFVTCSQRFKSLSSQLAKEDSRKLSRGLVHMLEDNVAAYSRSSSKAGLATCPVFTTAELQYPYSSAQPEFVSLADSADHDHYLLAALSLPIIDNSHGDTKALRHQLRLPKQPSLAHVVDHLLKLVATPDLGSSLMLPGHEFVLDGIRQGYQFIINSVSKSMAEGSLPNLGRESDRLAQEAWVLVQGCKFVRPCQLCFDLEEDTDQGNSGPV